MANSRDTSMRQRFRRAEDTPKAVVDPARATSKPQPKASPSLSPIIAFYVFLVSHLIAAVFSPIQDCDEVFNYWEPTHYLTHGHGFQTWEYSPEFAIRSWAYTSLHAVITLFGRLIPSAGETAEFYLLRIMLGFICALCEARLYSKISTVLNPRVAITFL
nr:alpha-1,2-mannosyltransferase alg9 [Quercus suber]